MKESIENRIDNIRKSTTPEELQEHVCPFYQKGGHPDCTTCVEASERVSDCKDYYLERITKFPMDIWCEDFDAFLAQERDQTGVDELVGVGINCNSCYMADKCPLFKADFVCGIKWDNNKPKTASEMVDFLVGLQYERVKRASVFEKIDGGVPDANLSGEMDRLSSLIYQKDNLGRDKVSISMEASGHAGGGILAKLFGGSGSALPEKTEKDVIDITTEIVEPIKIEEKKRNDLCEETFAKGQKQKSGC